MNCVMLSVSYVGYGGLVYFICFMNLELFFRSEADINIFLSYCKQVFGHNPKTPGICVFSSRISMSTCLFPVFLPHKMNQINGIINRGKVNTWELYYSSS